MRLIALLLPLFLAGCLLQDTASVELNGRDNAITLKRTQKWPWDSLLQVEVIMRRYPDCNAGGTISDVARDAKIAIYRPASAGAPLVLRTGKRFFSVNPANCAVLGLKDAPEERGEKADRKSVV
jgi:hypothetical protein